VQPKRSKTIPFQQQFIELFARFIGIIQQDYSVADYPRRRLGASALH
jgi:hypothetical protein